MILFMSSWRGTGEGIEISTAGTLIEIPIGAIALTFIVGI
jgi:hypothetical protein